MKIPKNIQLENSQFLQFKFNQTSRSLFDSDKD